jgi:hypothetical protein
MRLSLPPANFKELHTLVEHYNQVPEEEKVKQLFYLQQINYLLNTLTYDEDLFLWVHQKGEEGWPKALKQMGINVYGSFFLKTFQFAQAVSEAVKETVDYDKTPIDVHENPSLRYDLMQERDALFEKNTPYDDCKEKYIKLSCQLNAINQADEHTKRKIANQTLILANAKQKIHHIVYPDTEMTTGTGYQTKALGNHVNNYNYTFSMNGSPKKMVFRAEDRLSRKDDQILESLPVSKYFIEDYAMFMMAFKEKEEDEIAIQPVALSQFAKKGDLSNIAKTLRESPTKANDIGSQTIYYFEQLVDFCTKLINSGHYHPDIKLTNFLVDNNLIRVSDRKTIIKDKQPKAGMIRSTPMFAPNEYLLCLNPSMDGFNFHGLLNNMDMEAFMAFQLGMALKQFLILTQMEELPNEFRDPDLSVASYFKKPTNVIHNLSLLIKELTREDPNKRLKVTNIQKLLGHRNKPVDEFMKEIEKVLPSSDLGVQEDIDKIQELLKQDLTGQALLEGANPLFNKIKTMQPKEHRVIRLAEKLAIKCYDNASKDFCSKLVNDIDSLMAKHAQYDWDSAPWYRKFLHYVTFGWFKVKSTTTEEYLSKVNHGLNLKSDAFRAHLPQFFFLPDNHLDALGKSKVENLGIFINVHLKEIDKSFDKQSSNSGSASSDSESPKGSPKALGTLSSEEDNSSTGSLPTGSVQINTGKIAVEGSKEDAKWSKICDSLLNESKKKPSKLEWVGSHNSIFSKGDSERHKKLKRPPLSEKTFVPPEDVAPAIGK